MKFTDLGIIFAIIFCVYLIIGSNNNYLLKENFNTKIIINEKIDSASEDASYSLFHKGKEINKNKSLELFLESLAMNLEKSNSKYVKDRLLEYLPCFAIILDDGFYLIKRKEISNDQKNKVIKTYWSEKYLYSYADGLYVYKFFLRDYLEVYFKNENKKISGTYNQVINKIDIEGSILENKSKYNEIKKREIISIIEKNINFSLSEYNNIMKKFSKNIQFYFPKISHDNWCRSIENPGIFIVFQGLPLENSNFVYNYHTYSGISVLKNNRYIILVNKKTNKKIYHDKNCEKLKKILENTSEDYFIIEESNKSKAAKNGAFPCFECQ